MSDQINTTMSINLKSGVSQKDPKNPKEWTAVLVTIGDWSQLIFPKTSFEMDHIKKVIEANKK